MVAVGDAIGQVLSFAVGVAFSPVPIIAVVLMLGTPRARANGPAFVVGWVVGLSVVGTIVLLAASGRRRQRRRRARDLGRRRQARARRAARAPRRPQWRGRPRGSDEAALPKWMQTIDTFTPGRALGMGVLLSASTRRT